MVKVKICGITKLKDALAAIRSGCDGLGFVFYPKSRRYIAPAAAAAIIKRLPPTVVKIGVFADAAEKSVKRTARLCRLDMLQFHGQESPEFCRRFKKYKVIKAFRVKSKIDFSRVKKYKTFAYLFDASSPIGFGGTGKKFNWGLLTKQSECLVRPIFLAGGLSENNILKAIRSVAPAWVDVASAVEIKPGIKNHGKVSRFIKKVKNGGG